MKCNHCGAEIPDDSVFCESCGNKIGEESSNVSNNKPKFEKKTVKTIGIAAAGVVFAVLLAILLWPENTTNMYPVRDSQGKYGYIDENGIFIIQPIFDGAGEFSEGLASVKIGDKWGFIDEKGVMVIPPSFDNDYVIALGPYSFHEGLAVVVLADSWEKGYIDKKGRMIIKNQYDYASNFSEGLAMVEMGDKCGYIDKKGNIAIPLQYDNARDFCDGLAAVAIDGNWGIIDKKGKTIVPIKFQCINLASFSEGLAAFRSIGGLCGFVDKNMHVVISSQYGLVNDFSENLAAVINVAGDKYGYIDKKGNTVIPINYDRVSDFVGGVAIVQKGNAYYIIDKTGKIIKNINTINDTIHYSYFYVANNMKAIECHCNNYVYYLYLNRNGDIVYQSKTTEEDEIIIVDEDDVPPPHEPF